MGMRGFRILRINKFSYHIDLCLGILQWRFSYFSWMFFRVWPDTNNFINLTFCNVGYCIKTGDWCITGWITWFLMHAFRHGYVSWFAANGYGFLYGSHLVTISRAAQSFAWFVTQSPAEFFSSQVIESCVTYQFPLVVLAKHFDGSVTEARRSQKRSDTD